MTAYVDESLRLDGAGLYVLAAVLVPDGRAAAVRAALRDELRPGQRRLHFRKQGDADRLATCRTIRGLDVGSVVVTSPVDEARQERARRHCLLRLVWELDRQGEHALVLESRQRADALDRKMLEHARRTGITPRLRYRFGLPDQECLLWLPDVVAGSVARALAERDRRFLDALGAVAVTRL